MKLAVYCQEPFQSGRRERWPSEVAWERVRLGMTCIGGSSCSSTPHSEMPSGMRIPGRSGPDVSILDISSDAKFQRRRSFFASSHCVPR